MSHTLTSLGFLFTNGGIEVHTHAGPSVLASCVCTSRLNRGDTTPGPQRHWLSTRFTGKRCSYEYFAGVEKSFPGLDTCDSGADTLQWAKYMFLYIDLQFLVVHNMSKYTIPYFMICIVEPTPISTYYNRYIFLSRKQSRHFLRDSGVDTRHAGVDTIYFCWFRLIYEQIDNDNSISKQLGLFK